MTEFINKITLRRAALIAGFGYILMFGTPVAEFMVFQKLVDFHNTATTVHNIATNITLFRCGIFFYFINFLGDIIAAWAVYILLAPVNVYLSLLTAWMRLIYIIMSLVALMNLLTVLQLLGTHTYLGVFTTNQLNGQIMIALHSFRDDWSFSYLFFGIHLLMLGYVVFISKYVSKIVGICLMVAGLGWLTDSLQPLLFPNTNISVGMIAGVGELVFMLWLFIKGTRLKELN